MGKQSRRNRQLSGYVLRVVKLVGIRNHAHDKNLNCVEWKYVLSIPDIDCPSTWRFTNSPRKAMRFDHVTEAIDFYYTQSIRCPLRNDGKPNRPLTAYTMAYDEL